MNASMNITPGNAAQASSQAGKQADASSPDVPFSQVLSGEIAQNRKTDAAKEGSDSNTAADAASQAASPAAGKTDSAHPAKAGEDATHAHRVRAQAEDAAIAPETLLALAISPDAFKPAADAVGTKLAASEPASVPGAPGVPVLDPGKGRATPFTQPGQHAGQHASDARGTQKLDPHLAGPEDVHDAKIARGPTSADTAPAFLEQLAAARQADAAKKGERLPDLMSDPAMRAAPHALVEARLAAADAAAPRLAPSVGTAAWGQALGERLVWMAAGTQQTASLTLNPPHLGPLQIVVNVTNDQATASFFSAQPEVRHALEAAFPRLREMMNDAGIQLGQTTVSADTPRQNDTPDRQAERTALPFPGTDPAALGLQTVHAPVRQSGRGLVDTFA